MLKMTKWPMVLVAFFVALAPVAEASVTLMPDTCAMMAQATQHAAHPCCGSSCDCSIQQPNSPFSSDIPAQKPEFKLSVLSIQPDSYSIALVSPRLPELSTSEESPPQDTPLYQEYSDYRL